MRRCGNVSQGGLTGAGRYRVMETVELTASTWEMEALMPIDNWREFFNFDTIAAAFKRSERTRRIERIDDLAPLQRVRVDDIDVAFRELGRGEPLLMITAYSVSMDMWDTRLLRQLASRYRVIIFDNRGMGKTGAGKAPWSIDRFATDTAGLIRELGYDRANVLGWSLGGDVALGLAVAYPEMVERLIIYAGDCGGPHKIAAPRYHEVLKRVFRYGYVPFGEFLAILFPPSWMKAHPDYWRSVPLHMQRFHPRRFARQNRAYEEWPGVYEKLPAIETPVLVITGTEDVSTPPENADILTERIPGARLVRFRGAGHGLMYQYPDELSQSIIEFLLMSLTLFGCGSAKSKPKVNQLSPASGEAGSQLVINGESFGSTQGVGTVHLGTTLADEVAWADTAVTVKVPSDLAAAVYGVTVTTADGSSNDINFTVIAPVVTNVKITALKPASGVAGIDVIASGSGFGTTQGKILFGPGTAVVKAWSDTSVTFTVPASSTPNTYGVKVQTSAGSKSNEAIYTLNGAPPADLSAQLKAVMSYAGGDPDPSHWTIKLLKKSTIDPNWEVVEVTQPRAVELGGGTESLQAILVWNNMLGTWECLGVGGPPWSDVEFKGESVPSDLL